MIGNVVAPQLDSRYSGLKVFGAAPPLHVAQSSQHGAMIEGPRPTVPISTRCRVIVCRTGKARWCASTPGRMQVDQRNKEKSAASQIERDFVVDVARAAGVSTATVSRVLNGNAKVAAELQNRVRDIARELGYTPHAAARALASQRSKTIGAVIPSLENQNFAIGVFALQKRIGEAGYTLLLGCSYYDQEDELKQVRALIADGIAGLMLVGRSHSPALYELIEKEQIPLVNGWTVDHDYPYVGFDNVAVGRRLADYLLDLGHTRFGMITQMTQHSDRAADRIAACARRYSRAGCSCATSI